MRRRRTKTDTDKPPIIAVIEAYFDTTVPDPGSGHVKISCVFHEDNNPSMSVNVDTDYARCFSCSWGGDSYDLIQHVENTDFAGAQQIASEKFGTETPKRKNSKPPKRVSILEREHAPQAGGVRRKRPRLR